MMEIRGGVIRLEVRRPPHPGIEIRIATANREHSAIGGVAIVLLTAGEALELATNLEAAAEGVKAGDEITEILSHGEG